MPATPEALSDYERERGKPLPSFNHGTIQALVIGELLKHRDEFSIVSELSLELPRGEAGENGEPLRVTPDICVYPKKDVDWMRDEVRMTEPPLLAVEIIGPTQPSQDVVDKIQDMLGAGVSSCWFVQPAIRGVSVFTREAEVRTVTEDVLEDPATGIAFDVPVLFARG